LEFGIEPRACDRTRLLLLFFSWFATTRGDFSEASIAVYFSVRPPGITMFGGLSGAEISQLMELFDG